LLPLSRLPTVRARDVAEGSIPDVTFTDRIVLLGVTDPAHALHVDTPLGRLSPAEVEAHALIGLADGVVWAELPIALAYLGCGLFALVLLWAFSRLSVRQAAVLVVTSSLLVLVVDFATFQRGLIRLGSARMLLCVVSVGFSYWLHETVETAVSLYQLQAQLVREAAGEGSLEDEQGFWADLAQLGAVYAHETLVGVETDTTIVERVDDSWTLAPRSSHFDGAPVEDPQLRDVVKLDLRRAPFRTPWLTLRAGWATGLLPDDERKSLIVPIESDGDLFGLWLIHVDAAVEVTREQLDRFETLGRQLATTLIRRREREALRERAKGSRYRDYVDNIQGGLRMLQSEQRWVLDLLEKFPVQVLISTVWGEIEYIDPRLERLLANRYPGLFSADKPAETLRTILHRMTGESYAQIDHKLRNLSYDDELELALDVQPGVEDPGNDDVWALSRIRTERAIGTSSSFRPAVHEHVLLVLRSEAPTSKDYRTRSGKILRALRGIGGG